MWKNFIWVVIVGAVVGSYLIVERAGAVAVPDQGWTGKNARLVSQASVIGVASHTNTCSGMIQRVTIRSTGDTEACVLGEPGKTHLARYTGANYQYAYAIAMGDDTAYTRIDGFCSSLAWCAYSSSTDTLLMSIKAPGQGYGVAIVKDFTNYLTRHALPEPHYTFAYDEPYVPVSKDSSIMVTGALAVSTNGRWALVELQEYGFVRINMETGQLRRVVAPGVVYGVGGDPAFELAISNDGRFVAVAGWRPGVTVYQLDNGCGDMLTEMSGRQFTQGVIACQQSSIDYNALFPGFVFAEMPRFSDDGTRLSLLVLTPTSVTRVSITPLAATTLPATPLYVALGDSFVSGEGETDDAFYLPGTNTAGNTCHVSRRSYPYLLHPATSINALNKACSGSRIEEVITQNARIMTGSQVQPLESISVGVGGNDIDVMGKLKTCISPGTCEWARPERRFQTVQEIQRLLPRVVNLLSMMRQQYPGTKLYFVGYPKVINDAEGAHCRFPISALINQEERRYMNETVHYLNEVLAAAAKQAGVLFIDVEDAFEGERLCDQNETAMNGIRAGDDFAPIASLGTVKVIGAESFHPTPRGHERVAARIREALGTLPFNEPCTICDAASGLMPGAYWQEGDQPADGAYLVATRFLSQTSVSTGQVAAFRFPAHSFEPLGSVQLELHSDTQFLGTFTADEHGALGGIVTIPADASGYHAVHALGTSASGERIDRYETLFISADDANHEVLFTGSAKTGVTHQELTASPTHNPTVQGAMTHSVGSVLPARKLSDTQADWLVIWALGSAICLMSMALAYSIGRRQV